MDAKKKNLAVVLAVIGGLVAIGGAILINNGDSTKNNTSENPESSEVMEKKENEVMEKKEEGEAMEKNDGDVMEKKDGEVMEKDESSSSSSSRFITLASYNTDKSSYSENTKVLFFHASWCSICKGIEKEINADQNRIPSGTTMILTDFDSETALRQKYGVTGQYTFVQIDNDGNQVAKWSATSLDKALAGIKS